MWDAVPLTVPAECHETQHTLARESPSSRAPRGWHWTLGQAFANTTFPRPLIRAHTLPSHPGTRPGTRMLRTELPPSIGQCGIAASDGGSSCSRTSGEKRLGGPPIVEDHPMLEAHGWGPTSCFRGWRSCDQQQNSSEGFHFGALRMEVLRCASGLVIVSRGGA
jgi:hypothetical protein